MGKPIFRRALPEGTAHKKKKRNRRGGKIWVPRVGVLAPERSKGRALRRS